jgi:Ca2+-transporting ATPase
VNRSQGKGLGAALWRSNVALWFVSGSTTALLAAILAFPHARELFHFGPLHADDVAVACAVGVVVLIALNLLRRMQSEQR